MRLALFCSFFVIPRMGVAEQTVPMSPALLLEQGHFEMSILGDVDRAVATYARVHEHPESGQRTKAEAALGLAECHHLLGNELTAWFYYQELTGEEMPFPFLFETAIAGKLSLLIDLTENEGAFPAEALHYLGDVLIGIDGALRNEESKRADALIKEALTLTASLRELADAFPEENALRRMSRDLQQVRKDIGEGRFEEPHALLNERPFYRAFLQREALADTDEVFGYALEKLDRVALALNDENPIKAMEELRKVEAYLEPLWPWPKAVQLRGERFAYAGKLRSHLESLDRAIAKGALNDARKMMDAFCKEQFEDGGMVHWHLASLDEDLANPDVLPHYAAAFLCLEGVASQVELKEEGAELMNEAIARAQRLVEEQKHTSEEYGAETFLEMLRDVQGLVERGDTKALTDLFEDPDGESQGEH